MNLLKLKGYAIHAAASAVLFLTPAVQTWVVGHKAYAAGALLIWGWVLHWANGK